MPKRNGREEPEMPSTIERSDKHAQAIWKKTHDHAVDEYGEGEHAHRVAFASLKHSYKKEGDRWVAKDTRGPSDDQAARGPDTPVKSTDEPRAQTAGGRVDTGGKSKDELLAEARKLNVKGRSSMDKEELAQAIREKRR